MSISGSLSSALSGLTAASRAAEIVSSNIANAATPGYGRREVLTSVEVDELGYLNAIYDQGFTRTIYQLPVVDVPNPNGLISLSNQTYQVSPASGPFYLWDAGDGPTGAVVGFSREESATDVAAELTQLIQTQRAYSSNAKVIQTVELSLAVATDLPVEISDWVLLMLLLMLFMVCRATIAPLLVRIEDIGRFL